MKFLARLLPLVLLLCVFPAARAAELSGVWKGAFDFNDTSYPTTLKLAESGDAVTGTVEGLPTSPAEIHDGKVENGTLSFWVNTDYEGYTYKLVFKGKVSDEKIDFAFGTDDGQWGTEMSMTRGDAAAAIASLSGTWKGTFDLFGTATPIVFNLQSTGTAVTGTVVNSEGKASEIHDGKIENGSISFWIDTVYQGENYTLHYQGKLAGDAIDFDFGLADGSWSATVTAKKA